MKKRKLSEAYILSVQKLFAIHIREPMGAICLTDVSPKRSTKKQLLFSPVLLRGFAAISVAAYIFFHQSTDGV
jgi:hypothetical protein